MSEKRSAKWLTGTAGVLVVLAILISVNFLLNAIQIRVDLTSEKLYTLSDGTKTLLGELDRTVAIKFYFSRSNEQIPVPLKQYAQRIRNLLKEYQMAGKGRIVLEIYDPRPDSDEEEWAQRYGLIGQPLGGFGGPAAMYMGLAAVSGKKEAALPFLAPALEPQLEYLLTRLIFEVTQSKRSTVGVMSSLPVMGAPASPYPPQFQQQRPKAWLAIDELKRQYQVTQVDNQTSKIPGDVDLLLLIHPKQLSEATLFALDQFVLQGGRLLAFIDPMCVVEQETAPQRPGQFGGNASDLNKLTKAWGLEMAAGQVVADQQAASPVSTQAGTVERMPTWLSLRGDAFDKEEIVTGMLDFVMMINAGLIVTDTQEGLTLTPLLTSSEDTSTINSFMANMPGPGMMRDASFKGASSLAVRLNGNFKTAFPGGPPSSADASSGEDTVAKPVHLMESANNSVVILVSDVDMLYDRFWARSLNIFGQTAVQPLNDNVTFLLNLVEQLAGSEALIGLRSRGTYDRPFHTVLRLEKKAQEEYQQEELRLQSKLQETQARLNELQQAKEDDQKFILSPAQKKELEKFRKERFDTQRQLKEVRKKLRSDIEQLGFSLKLLNMAAMPILVAAFGIVRGWRRKSSS